MAVGSDRHCSPVMRLPWGGAPPLRPVVRRSEPGTDGPRRCSGTLSGRSVIVRPGSGRLPGRRVRERIGPEGKEETVLIFVALVTTVMTVLHVYLWYRLVAATTLRGTRARRVL